MFRFFIYFFLSYFQLFIISATVIEILKYSIRGKYYLENFVNYGSLVTYITQYKFCSQYGNAASRLNSTVVITFYEMVDNVCVVLVCVLCRLPLVPSTGMAVVPPLYNYDNDNVYRMMYCTIL